MFQLDQGFYQTLKVKMVVLLLSTACFPGKKTVLSIDQSKYCKQVRQRIGTFQLTTSSQLESTSVLSRHIVFLESA